MNANRGVVALRMAARADSIRVSAQLISTNGNAVLKKPMNRYAGQEARNVPNGWRVIRATASSPIRPNSRRNAANVAGDTSATAILIQRNDEPQIPPRRRNAPQSLSRTDAIIPDAARRGK